MPTIHCLICGRVQGVNYRAATRDTANRLGVAGWVRNTDDGKVELTATGPEAALRQLVEWCRQGPPHASVSAVSTDRLPETAFEGFIIRRG